MAIRQQEGGEIARSPEQFPDLNRLRRVLGDRQALLALRSGISLGDAQRFQQALVEAKNALQEAKATVTTGYKGEKDMLRVMESIQELAQSISDEMRAKAAK